MRAHILLLAVVLFTQIGVAQEPGGDIALLSERLFSRLPACTVNDFTLPPSFTEDIKFDPAQPLATSEIERFSHEVAWTLPGADYYGPEYATNRFQTAQSLRALVDSMLELGISEVSLLDLVPYANREIEARIARSEIGACYVLQTLHSPLVPAKINAAVTPGVQRAIESLFSLSLDEQGMPLSNNERTLLERGVFTAAEIAELRALRKATEIFEGNTVLKNDKKGNIWTNLRAEMFGKDQQLCADEAETYRNFILTLESRGLLKNFRGDGKISKNPGFFRDWTKGGHVAARLQSLRTGEIIVVDGWYEKGGAPAHVLLEEDWLRLPVSSLFRIRFNDAVEVINP